MSSPVPARTRLAYRAVAVILAAATVYLLAVFGGALAARQVRTALVVYVSLTGPAAVGMWFVTGWGRVMTLVIAVANAGLGTLTLLAAILDEAEPALVPGVFLAVNVVGAYALSRPLFSLPHER